MTSDFIISVHALERFEERFPTLWTNDDDTGLFIYHETMDAINEGRCGTIPPLELANNDFDRWVAGKSRIAWVPMKTRGYVLVETDEGLTVATVLVGRSTAEARSRLYGKRQKADWLKPSAKDGET